MRMLHTMLRVGDLERSIRFYTEVLGMQLLRRKDYPSGRFTLAFVGYGDERDNTVLELTHNWDTEQYALGDGYGHIALGLDDIYSACTAIADACLLAEMLDQSNNVEDVFIEFQKQRKPVADAVIEDSRHGLDMSTCRSRFRNWIRDWGLSHIPDHKMKEIVDAMVTGR